MGEGWIDGDWPMDEFEEKEMVAGGWFDQIWEDHEVDAGVWRRRVRERWDN